MVDLPVEMCWSIWIPKKVVRNGSFEGAQINLSLSALGNVINALTEKSSGGWVFEWTTSRVPTETQSKITPQTILLRRSTRALPRLQIDTLTAGFTRRKLLHCHLASIQNRSCKKILHEVHRSSQNLRICDV